MTQIQQKEKTLLDQFLNKEAAYRDRKNAAQSLLFVKDLAVFERWPEDFFKQSFDPKEPLEFQRWALLLASKAEPSTTHEQWSTTRKQWYSNSLLETHPLSLRVLAARLLLSLDPSPEENAACLETFRVGLHAEDLEQALDTAETVGLLLAQNNPCSQGLVQLLLEQLQSVSSELQIPLLQALAMLPASSEKPITELQKLSLKDPAQSFLKRLLDAWKSSVPSALLSILQEDEEEDDEEEDEEDHDKRVYTHPSGYSEHQSSSSLRSSPGPDPTEAADANISEPELPSSTLLFSKPMNESSDELIFRSYEPILNKSFFSPVFARFSLIALVALIVVPFVSLQLFLNPVRKEMSFFAGQLKSVKKEMGLSARKTETTKEIEETKQGIVFLQKRIASLQKMIESLKSFIQNQEKKKKRNQSLAIAALDANANATSATLSSSTDDPEGKDRKICYLAGLRLTYLETLSTNTYISENLKMPERCEDYKDYYKKGKTVAKRALELPNSLFRERQKQIREKCFDEKSLQCEELFFKVSNSMDIRLLREKLHKRHKGEYQKQWKDALSKGEAIQTKMSIKKLLCALSQTQPCKVPSDIQCSRYKGQDLVLCEEAQPVWMVLSALEKELPSKTAFQALLPLLTKSRKDHIKSELHRNSKVFSKNPIAYAGSSSKSKHKDADYCRRQAFLEKLQSLSKKYLSLEEPKGSFASAIQGPRCKLQTSSVKEGYQVAMDLFGWFVFYNALTNQPNMFTSRTLKSLYKKSKLYESLKKDLQFLICGNGKGSKGTICEIFDL